MLAVITDDFTGASEIGGVALARGYRTVIETRNVRPDDAEVVVIASNMRSLDPGSAREKSRELTRELLRLEPTLIFKKIDSVLRGNIGPELEGQLQAEGKTRALLVPANPSRGRVVIDGVYFVEKAPIADSGFAASYDFGPPTSRVVDILRHRNGCEAVCLPPGDLPAEAGIYIGNAANAADLRAWARQARGDVVPAGAAEFFGAVLDACLPAESSPPASCKHSAGTRMLYICGSNFPTSRNAVSDARGHGVRLLAMPDELYFRQGIDEGTLDDWAGQVIEALREEGRVIIAALQSPNGDSLAGRDIARVLGEVARRAVAEEAIDDLMIEGGATAQAVLSALDVASLYPVQSLAPGVTRMRVDGRPKLHVTMKPGSYRWPEAVWTQG